MRSGQLTRKRNKIKTVNAATPQRQNLESIGYYGVLIGITHLYKLRGLSQPFFFFFFFFFWGGK